ncbi:phosphonate transport system substrate-binding protein [Humidesulfovibrio mexicanus]|uniref:Phosphonate transport system substrate-binding protein n=2 Tax=Humidesulfovibrio mexicanus TaxID=147047 RepID=A0A239CIS0_9BACT|nr:phosphonate transport system substrate-binding protein [Humidesulfovibrio mexicanus]
MWATLEPFHNRLARLALVILCLLAVHGCDGGGAAKTVDFSRTVQVDRPSEDQRGGRKLRMAVAAMISPKDTFDLYRQLLTYISRRMDVELEFVQRKTYAEISELLRQGLVDVAFVCSGPYATGKQKYGLELLATPEIRGSHFYQAYLIVGKDSPCKELRDLKGKTFAFTDPDSNTGRLVPLHWLATLGERPDSFFSKTIYTYSHDNSILAVSRGLVDGAAVDGLIWEFYARRNPEFTAQTRVILKSEPFGIPPVVVSEHLDRGSKERIQEVLFHMHEDAEGKKILGDLSIDRFIAPSDEWYASIRNLERTMLSATQDKGHGGAKP